MSESSVNPSEPRPPRRAYVSPKRAEAAQRTRQAIRDAAEALFLRDGYSRTSMKAIAKHAGVSEKTMYLTFASKAALLLAVVQVAVRGDEAPGPLADRPEWRALLHGPADEVIERFAASSAALMARTAPIIAVGEAAADVDPELAAYRDLAHEANLGECRALAAALEHRGALAPGVGEQEAADIIYAIASTQNIFLRLTRECGWTEARYAGLIARTLEATIGRRSS